MSRLLLCLAVTAALPMLAQTPDPTLPPANQRAVLTLRGEGAQVYSCQQTKVGFGWIFQAPAARLFNAEGREVGTHGDGPLWTLEDSSSISGVRIADTPGPDTNSVPGLLLKAVNPLRSGLLSGVEYIRRADTRGGAAPTDGCNAARTGELAHVPYTATYIFYSSHSPS